MVIAGVTCRGEMQRAIDADAEDQQVTQRVQKIPEDEHHVRDADLGFAMNDGAKGTHCDVPFAVNSTKTSSRLAPPTSTLRIRPRVDSSLTSSNTRRALSFNAISTVLRLTENRSGCRRESSSSRPAGSESKVNDTS